MLIPKSANIILGSAISDYEFVAIADNTTTFTIPVDQYNFANDRLVVYYQGVKLKLADNYSMTENVVTLGFSINTGDSIQYTITKTA